MSSKISECIFDIGQVDKRHFSPHGRPGDWEEWTVKFAKPFPDTPKVILTANDFNVPDISFDPWRRRKNPAVVGVIRELTDAGFKLAGRNSECHPGEAGFNWLAILETPGSSHPTPEIRRGIVPPQVFGAHCTKEDQNFWLVPFKQLSNPPIVLLTATYMLHPWRDVSLALLSSTASQSHDAAAVGIARTPESDKFLLAARNADIDEGTCAFNWAGFSTKQERGFAPNLLIDTGLVLADHYEEKGTTGDRRSFFAYFDEPFLTSPIVLVTAVRSEPWKAMGNPAVTGIVHNVTPYGFKITGYNTDCDAGYTGFHWVAIGWSETCCNDTR